MEKRRKKINVMEITTYVNGTETHIADDKEIRFKILHEITDYRAFYPLTGDKEYPECSCEWRNPYEDDEQGDLKLYQTLKREYHEKYGPLTLKQYSQRFHIMMEMFHASQHLRCSNKKYIRRVWVLKQLYELANGSLELIATRVKKGVIALYERAVKFMNEHLEIEKTNQMEKYTNLALECMYIFCEKMPAFFAKNPSLVSALNLQSKAYFVQSSTPAMISTFNFLQKNRWIEPELIPHVEPKYYAYWKKFWATILTRTLCSDNICLGQDVCHKIAEYIPERIVGASFIDFFKKRFDIKNEAYIGKKHFEVTCISNQQSTEIIVLLK